MAFELLAVITISTVAWGCPGQALAQGGVGEVLAARGVATESLAAW